MTVSLSLLAALAVLCGPLVAGQHLVAVTQRGLLRLDAAGALLDWRRDQLPPWQLGHSVALIPQNNTVCWFRAPTVDLNPPGALRCALLDNFGETWDLPVPRELPLLQITALAFDWTGQNWHFTGSQARKLWSSFVCSYEFERCVDVGPPSERHYFASAYDIPNRLLLRLIPDQDGQRRLQVAQLDGSGARDVPVEMGIAVEFAVDPVGRRLYWTEQDEDEKTMALYSVNYEGKDKQRLWERTDGGHMILNVTGGHAIVAWSPLYRNQIAVLGLKNTTEPAVKTQATEIQALDQLDDLLTLALVSPEEIISQEFWEEDVEDKGVCSDCSGVCVPTMVDGTETATCFCPEGERLLGLRCWPQHPAYAAVLGAESLQTVNLQTGEVTTLLANLTDAGRADVFWAGGEQFVLFWVDVGGLYRAEWSPAGLQGAVELLVPSTDSERVTDVAVDWSQRQLLWMSRRDDKHMVVQLSRLDGSHPRTVLTQPWSRQHLLTVHETGRTFTYRQLEPIAGAWTVQRWTMTGESASRTAIITAAADMADSTVAVSMTGDEFQDRTLWLDRTSRSVYSQPSAALELWSEDERTTLLTHPSLEHAGGLGRLVDDRLFWTDTSTGTLWSVDALKEGDEPRALAEVPGGGALRLLHPWTQPAASEPVCGPGALQCSQLCLRTVGYFHSPSAECACADGFQLADDGKTCELDYRVFH